MAHYIWLFFIAKQHIIYIYIYIYIYSIKNIKYLKLTLFKKLCGITCVLVELSTVVQYSCWILVNVRRNVFSWLGNRLEGSQTRIPLHKTLYCNLYSDIPLITARLYESSALSQARTDTKEIPVLYQHIKVF